MNIENYTAPTTPAPTTPAPTTNPTATGDCPLHIKMFLDMAKALPGYSPIKLKSNKHPSCNTHTTPVPGNWGTPVYIVVDDSKGGSLTTASTAKPTGEDTDYLTIYTGDSDPDPDDYTPIAELEEAAYKDCPTPTCPPKKSMFKDPWYWVAIVFIIITIGFVANHFKNK